MLDSIYAITSKSGVHLEFRSPLAQGNENDILGSGFLNDMKRSNAWEQHFFQNSSVKSDVGWQKCNFAFKIHSFIVNFCYSTPLFPDEFGTKCCSQALLYEERQQV